MKIYFLFSCCLFSQLLPGPQFVHSSPISIVLGPTLTEPTLDAFAWPAVPIDLSVYESHGWVRKESSVTCLRQSKKVKFNLY